MDFVHKATSLSTLACHMKVNIMQVQLAIAWDILSDTSD